MHLENSQTSKMELSLGNRERLKFAGYSRKKKLTEVQLKKRMMILIIKRHQY